MNKKNILISVIVVAIIAVGAWYFLSNSGSSSYGDVVAVVNGEEITGEEFGVQFKQAKEAYSEEDSEFNEEQLKEYVLDQIISSVLLKQEAENKGFTVDESEIQEEIDFIVQSGGGQEVFEGALAESGISEEMLRKDIKNQILVNDYIVSEFPEEEVSVTDEEILALYDSYSQTVTEGEMPSFGDVEGELRAEIIQQKRSDMITSLISSLREEAEVEVLL
jgi:parvulin-like peptidyl-prolyl isomerase